jgi:hypothetical protein
MSIKIALLTGIVLSLTGSPVVAQAPKTDQQANAPIPQGRYQIVISPHAARDTFLLDTETGRVWQLTMFSFLNDEPVVWNVMPRIDNDDDYAKVVRDHGRKSRQSPPAR